MIDEYGRRKINNEIVNIWSYFISITTSSPGWILCVVTLERLFVLAFPFRAALICTKKNSRIILVVMHFIICVIFISNFFRKLHSKVEFVFNESTSQFQVQYNCYYPQKDNTLYKWSFLLMRCLIPFHILLIMNISILVLLYQTLKNRRRLGVRADPGDLVFLTKLLITASLTYLLLSLPHAVYLVLGHGHLKHLYSSDDEYIISRKLWATSIATYLLFFNHSINFILYCIAGKKFRDEFVSMMSCINMF